MRRATTIWRISVGALASLVMAFTLACDANGKSGTEADGDDSSSVDLSWAVANPDAPGPGDQAPMLAIEETLSGSVDGDADWATLRGKATVLEFWATWCAPCVQVIPHLNGLADDLSEEDIRFVSITDEEEGTVAPFLESIPISGLVGLDLDRSAFRDYGVLSIPTTFLVDKEGVIQAVTRAHDLTKEDLLDLIAGRRPDVPEIEDFREFFEVEDEGAEAVFEISVRPSTKPESGMARGPGRMTLISFAAEDMISTTFGVSPGRLVMEAELPDQTYDVVVNTGRRGDLLEPMVQQAVSAVLGIEARWEERVVDCYVLVKKGEPKLNPLPDDGRSGYRVSSDSLGATDLDGLVGRVAFLLGRPTLNETGITGRFQILLEYDSPEPETVFQAIEDTLGLAVVEEKRPIEMLVVRKQAAGVVR